MAAEPVALGLERVFLFICLQGASEIRLLGVWIYRNSALATGGCILTREQYEVYLRSLHWKLKCQEALMHYGHKCWVCEALDGGTDPEAILEVHHRHYRTLWCEDVEKDLVVLCRHHHKLLHKSGAMDPEDLWENTPYKSEVTWK